MNVQHNDRGPLSSGYVDRLLARRRFDRPIARPLQDRRDELSEEGVVVDNEDWTGSVLDRALRRQSPQLPQVDLTAVSLQTPHAATRSIGQTT